MGSFFSGPCTQVQGRGCCVHRDTAPGISCIRTGGWIVTHTVGLDSQHVLVVEGSRCQESDSQVFCHRNWVHLVSLAGQTPLPQCHVRTTTGAST